MESTLRRAGLRRSSRTPPLEEGGYKVAMKGDVAHTIKLMLLPGPPLENQGGVGAAETEGIRQRVFHFRFARDIGNVVEIAIAGPVFPD